MWVLRVGWRVCRGVKGLGRSLGRVVRVGGWLSSSEEGSSESSGSGSGSALPSMSVT